MLFGDSWPELHGAVTHFPVALLIVAAFFDFCAAVCKKPKLREASLAVLVLAVLACIPTIITGRITAGTLYGASPVVPPIVSTHQTFAYITSGLAVLLLIWRLATKDKLTGAAFAASVVFSLVIAGLVGYVGHLGGKMVFGDTTPAPPVAVGNTGPSVNPALANQIAAGHMAYQNNGCTSCHAINGTGGHAGPDLTHEGSSGHNTAWEIAHLIKPTSKSPRSTMPPYATLSKGKLSDLAAYLTNLK